MEPTVAARLTCRLCEPLGERHEALRGTAVAGEAGAQLAEYRCEAFGHTFMVTEALVTEWRPHEPDATEAAQLRLAARRDRWARNHAAVAGDPDEAASFTVEERLTQLEARTSVPAGSAAPHDAPPTKHSHPYAFHFRDDCSRCQETAHAKAAEAPATP